MTRNNEEAQPPVVYGEFDDRLTILWTLINAWRDAPPPALHICGKINSYVLSLIPAASPPQPAQRKPVNEGWKLVPVEPTEDMWKAVNKLDDEMAAGSYDGKGCSIEQAWHCLLDAAPTPPAQQQEPVACIRCGAPLGALHLVTGDNNCPFGQRVQHTDCAPQPAQRPAQPQQEPVPPSAYESLTRDMTTIAARQVPRGVPIAEFAMHALADAELREHDAAAPAQQISELHGALADLVEAVCAVPDGSWPDGFRWASVRHAKDALAWGPAPQPAQRPGSVDGGPDCEDGPDEEGFSGPRPWNNFAAEPTAGRRHVGDSRFESWYSEDFDPSGKELKQLLREAYEAGLNDRA